MLIKKLKSEFEHGKCTPLCKYCARFFAKNFKKCESNVQSNRLTFGVLGSWGGNLAFLAVCFFKSVLNAVANVIVMHRILKCIFKGVTP